MSPPPASIPASPVAMSPPPASIPASPAACATSYVGGVRITRSPSPARSKTVRSLNGRCAPSASQAAGEPPTTIIYGKGFESMAIGLQKELEARGESILPPMCTEYADSSATLAWGHFANGDPNIKLNVAALHDRHVILLMSMDSIKGFFEQLAVLLHLQRFRVPKVSEEFAEKKWKGLGEDDFEPVRYLGDSQHRPLLHPTCSRAKPPLTRTCQAAAYAHVPAAAHAHAPSRRSRTRAKPPLTRTCQAAAHAHVHTSDQVCGVRSLAVIVPWNRFCQMERTSRWTKKEGRWYNGEPSGEYVDVPTLESFAQMISFEPSEGKTCARHLLFIDIHEVGAALKAPRGTRLSSHPAAHSA